MTADRYEEGRRAVAEERRYWFWLAEQRAPTTRPRKISRSLVNKVIEYYGSDCYLCGRVLLVNEVTMDHVIPRSKGGSNHIDNLRPACRPCNTAKGNTMPEEQRDD